VSSLSEATPPQDARQPASSRVDTLPRVSLLLLGREHVKVLVYPTTNMPRITMSGRHSDRTSDGLYHDHPTWLACGRTSLQPNCGYSLISPA
jgi:hypothetical protein